MTNAEIILALDMLHATMPGVGTHEAAVEWMTQAFTVMHAASNALATTEKRRTDEGVIFHEWEQFYKERKGYPLSLESFAAGWKAR